MAGAAHLKGEVSTDPRGKWVAEIAMFRAAVKWAMVGFGTLAIATPWLIDRRRLKALAPGAIAKSPPSERQWFWGGVALFTIASGVLWSTRMDRSLWTDELTSMRQVMVGRWKHDNNDAGRLLQPSWADTLLFYETPNNHLAYSVTARLVHEKLGGINQTHFGKPYFDAARLRLPALIAGLACIALVGYLALRLHSLLAAWLAMAWTALHPWMLEFATSARGYSFAMFFLALASVAAVKVFRGGGGWCWWIVYGLAQLLAFATIPTLLHGLVALNLAVCCGLLFDRTLDRGVRVSHIGAFFAVNIVAGIGAILSIYPRLEQLKNYLDGDQFSVDMPLGWLGDCFFNLLTGQPYNSWDEEGDHPWAFSADQWPALLVVAAVLLALVFAALGLREGRRRGLFAVLLLLSFAMPQLTVFAQGKAMHFYLFPWYTVWGLPLVLVLFAVGAATLIQSAAARRPAWLTPVMGAAFVLLLTVVTHRPRTAYLNVSVEPMMESAASFRPSPNPWAPGHEKVLSCSLISANHGYDPWNRRLRSAADLLALAAVADETGKPLYCDTSWMDHIPEHIPEFAPYLLDGRYFELVGRFYGLQPQNSRYVLRYLPGSLSEKALTDSP